MEKYREYLTELNDILLRDGIDLGIERDLKQGALERPQLILEQYFEFNKSLAISDSEKAISIGTGEGNFLYNNLLYKKLQEEYEDTMKGALALLYSEVEDESPLTEEEIYQQRVDAFNAYLVESKELNAQRVLNEQEPDDSIVLFKDCKGYSGLSYTVDSVIEGASYEGTNLSYDEINAENGVGIDENGDIIDYDDGIYTETVDGSDDDEVGDFISYEGTPDEDDEEDDFLEYESNEFKGTPDEDEEDDSLDYESDESDNTDDLDEEDDSFEYESDEPEVIGDSDEDYYDDSWGTDDLEEDSDEEDSDEEDDAYDDSISLEEEDSEEDDDSVSLEEEYGDSEEEDDSYGDEDDSLEDEGSSLEDEDDEYEDDSIFSEDEDEDCEDEEVDEDSFTIEDGCTESDEDEDEGSFNTEYDSTDSDEDEDEDEGSFDSDDDEEVDDSIDYEDSGYEEEEDDSILEDFSEEEEEEDDSFFLDEDEEDDTFPVLDDEVPPTPSTMVAPPPVPAEESMVRRTAVKMDSNDSFASFILGISDKVEKGGKALGKRCKDSHARVRDSK